MTFLANLLKINVHGFLLIEFGRAKLLPVPAIMLQSADTRFNKSYSALEFSISRGNVMILDEFLEDDQATVNSQEANTPAFWKSISGEKSPK